MPAALLPLVFLLAASFAAAEPLDPLQGWQPPRGYVCYKVDGNAIQIDGKLDEPAWQSAPWTDDFLDIEGDAKPKPRFRTRAKMLWTDEYFLVAVEMEEPHASATLTRRDSVIFHDNDFEIFIDPDGDSHGYGEFEVNALNTGWDLRLPMPYKDGGQADDGWDIEGIKTAVHIDGTINDPRDVDRGWSVEMALPWRALATLADRSLPIRPARRQGSILEGYEPEIPAPKTRRKPPADANAGRCPPQDNDQWRVNFSRVQWLYEIEGDKYVKTPNRREDNWVWSPQGVIDMHRPETWGYVQFSTAAPGKATFQPDPAGPAKALLHRVYYAQRKFHAEHQRYARSIAELQLPPLAHSSLATPIELIPTTEEDSSGYVVQAKVKRPGGASVIRLHQDAGVDWQP